MDAEDYNPIPPKRVYFQNVTYILIGRAPALPYEVDETEPTDPKENHVTITGNTSN